VLVALAVAVGLWLGLNAPGTSPVAPAVPASVTIPAVTDQPPTVDPALGRRDPGGGR
jgi:hypothetical protein